MEERPGTERGSHRRPRGQRPDGGRTPNPRVAAVAPRAAPLDPQAAATVDDGRLEPLDVDGVVPVLVITALWGVAAVVLVLLRDDLAANDTGWWLWTSVAGFGLGLIGFTFVRRRRDARRQATT